MSGIEIEKTFEKNVVEFLFLVDPPDGLLLAAITLKRNRVEKLGCTMQLGNNVGNLNLRKI